MDLDRLRRQVMSEAEAAAAVDEITALRAEVERLKGNEIIDDAEIKALREDLDTAVGLILRALRYGMNRSEYYNALKAADVGAEMAKFVEGK